MLVGASAALGLSARAGQGLAAAGVQFGPAEPFSFDALVAKAKGAAGKSYVAPSPGDPALEEIDFDAYGQITFDPKMELFGGKGGPAVRLFPMGRLFKTPVRISVVEGGAARPIIYQPSLFQTPPSHPLRRLRDGGFAGFRIMNPDGQGDWLAFLGASYFRSAGAFNQYGASARGLAVNSGGPAREEFPMFTAFWLERWSDGGLVVHALLDSPSVVGAYRFDNQMTSRGVVQTVETALFFRRPVETLGIAPLTSMFWYGENARPARHDWRPEIHDSDGLALWTGAGERIWRPLSNPPRVITNTFQDDNPKAFGLLQRDRAFDHYQDDGAFYEKRPSLWVEPLTPFGEGSVRLVEIPSDKETDDNIVAYWTPRRPVVTGDALRLRYRLSWLGEDPSTATLAKAVATRIGVGGRPGQPPKPGYHRIAIDFEGGPLTGLTRASGVEAAVTAGGGSKVDEVSAYPVVGTTLWRVLFDIAEAGAGPIDVRVYLRRGTAAMSETWLYQLFPTQ